MRILFLWPHPAEDRGKMYYSASRVLANRFGHQVVFVYIGESRDFGNEIAIEHFDSWVKENRDLIGNTSLLDLEREFPQSNLWRSVVAQRTLADYSYIGDSFPVQHRSLPEIENYLKSVVLFYRYVLDKYQVEVAMAHAADVIHSHMLFELAHSRPFFAINQFYSPYWQKGRYPVDIPGLKSSALNMRYEKYMREYKDMVLPRLPELEAYLTGCCLDDPTRQTVLKVWPTSLSSVFKTSWNGLIRGRSLFTLRSGDTLTAYYRRPLVPAVKAWMIRSKNLAERRISIRFASAAPERPFVLFAPHYQPESATLASAPVWSDMLALLRMLSVSLPSGYQLAVKDHPAIGGNRPASFYRHAARLPNVILFAESFPSVELLKRCSMAVTVTGTAGLQALFFGKPTLLFGPAYFDCLGGVLHPPADLNDLPMLMKNVLINEQVPSAEERRRSLMAFLAAYKDGHTFNPKMENGPTPEERGEGLAELIHGWLKNDLAHRRQPERELMVH
jgi:hypothetical protein